MRIFFDNCTSPTLAATLNGFVTGQFGYSALHIKDLPCGRDASDIEWIEFIAGSGNDWLIITGDLRIHKNRAERQSYRRAGLRGIVMAPAFQGMKLHQQASLLLWRWPDIEGLYRLAGAPFLFELPVNRSSKLRPLPV